MTYNTPTPEELEFLKSIEKVRHYGLDARNQLYAVYNRLFNTNIPPSSCGRCLGDKHRQLMIILKNETNG